jgi:hypothetical protein
METQRLRSIERTRGVMVETQPAGSETRQASSLQLVVERIRNPAPAGANQLSPALQRWEKWKK